MASQDTPSFEEYWADFVKAHAHPGVRRVHFVATSAGIACALLGVVSRRASLLLLAPAIALVPADLAHRLMEPDAPRLPLHPLYGAAATLRMWTLMLRGQMEEELSRVVATAPAEPDEVSDSAPLPAPNMVTDHTLH